MKILELFSGTKSFSKVADAQPHNHETFTVDINKRSKPDLIADILTLTEPYTQIPFIPDIIWASPPCTEYSIAKTVGTRNLTLADSIVQHTLTIIDYYKKLNPNLIWIMENPKTGLLKSRPFMLERNLPYKDVTYCSYGYLYKKQTRFWTNLTNWTPRPLCKQDCQSMKNGRHIASVGSDAPGYKRTYRNERYSIPPQLCEEILRSINNEN